jgi:hypothetical protein
LRTHAPRPTYRNLRFGTEAGDLIMVQVSSKDRHARKVHRAVPALVFLEKGSLLARRSLMLRRGSQRKITEVILDGLLMPRGHPLDEFLQITSLFTRGIRPHSETSFFIFTGSTRSWAAVATAVSSSTGRLLFYATAGWQVP